jgi:thioredoxin reductase (NADPH)
MVFEIKKLENSFEIKTSMWKEFKAKYVLVTTWTNHRKLWVPWEEKYAWRWVSYCATCDWMFFKDKEIAVVWGGNTALTESLYLAGICKKVYVIHRREHFTCDTCWFEEANKNEKIEILFTEEIVEIIWNEHWVTGIELKSGKKLNVNAVFVAVWVTPNTTSIDALEPEKDKWWYIVVDPRQETSIKWIFAAWDVTTNSNKFMQAITAAAEWALAVSCIQEDLLKGETSSEILKEVAKKEDVE